MVCARGDDLRYPYFILNITTGTRIGPYEVVAPLGAGGMGEVWRARDTRLDRSVAIKVLPPEFAHDAQLKARFEREAKTISQLNHPNICTLYDVGHESGSDYLVMELIEGESLSDRLARGPLPISEVLKIGAQLADALDRAHRAGIVHRDLKPGNIMLTRSGAKLLDFGLAKSSEAASPSPSPAGASWKPAAADEPTRHKPLTQEGSIVGTFQYMAPEQLEGADADARTDIFALGAVLYEMATGKRAFEGKSRASLIAAIMEREPPPISAIHPMTPQAFDQTVRRCMAKQPDDRIQSARDLVFALQEIGDQIRLREAPRTDWNERRALLYAVVAVVVASIGLAGWFAWRHRSFGAGLDKGKSIAVLPFAGLGVDRSRQFLLLAIPDEITTILSYSPDLAVRPFSVSRRLSGDIDPQEAAQKLNASDIISGHVMDEGGHLSVTLEAIDIQANKLVWRDVFEVPSADLINMRRELTNRIRSGLLPRLSGSAGNLREGSGPNNSEAYALYLRAAAASSDVAPNTEALQWLEEAVRLDPIYAPAWAALSKRAYYDYTYATGGDAAKARAREAATHALQLDPDLVDATVQLVVIDTEDGETVNAYRNAKKLVSRRPDSAEAHFLLSYVLRYGGALQESARECDAAWSIDRGNRGQRSCSTTFVGLGNYDRALDFIHADAGTQWSNNMTAFVMLRQGKAREAIPLFQSPRVRQMVAAFLDHSPAPITELRTTNSNRTDGEPFYFMASSISFCNRPTEALGFLREAVRRNYCTYPAIEKDPLFASVRALPEYKAFRETAVACQARFLSERDR
jgi:serine/threonine protein kinase/tetratricopeptide (TPR) repeat protein